MKEEDKKRLMRMLRERYSAQASGSSTANKIRSQAEEGPLRKERQKRARKPVRKNGFILLFSGIAVTVSSLTFASTVLAFIGLTLTFWGLLFLLILPGKYVTTQVLDSMALSSLSALNKVIADSNCRGKAVYLPPYPKDVYVPQHLRDSKDGSVFISAKNDKLESVIEQAYTKNPKGLRLVPPGLSLANLIEKESGVNLFNTNLDSLTETLPSVFVDGLELADDFKINLDKDLVHVQMSGLKCENLCKEASKLKNICPNLGCPLNSSIACVLTKTTNNPVVIERCRLKDNVIEIWYRILKD